jgi:hypothetical protein
VRWLQQHVGLHRQRRNSLRSIRCLVELPLPLQPAKLEHQRLAPRPARLLPRRLRLRHLPIRLVRWRPARPQRHSSIRLRPRLGIRPPHQLPDRRPRPQRLLHHLSRQPHRLQLVTPNHEIPRRTRECFERARLQSCRKLKKRCGALAPEGSFMALCPIHFTAPS